MLKKNIAQYVEIDAQAKQKTESFCESVDHGKSHGEIVSSYRDEIHRLNRELLLTVKEAASKIEIKKCDHAKTTMEFCGGSEYVERCNSCGAVISD